MAKQEVSGRTKEGIQELRDVHRKSEPFEDTYCLAKIPHQPEDYDGPVRYCANPRVKEIGDAYLCKYHGGAGSLNTQNLDKLAPMKHGMRAELDHLVEDFDEKDQAIYDWITGTWPQAYDIDLDEDPQAQYDFHRLAAEIVRAERGRGYLIREGEITEQEKYNEEGRIVVDENGEVVTEKSQHYLADMMHKQDNKISSIEKELGISRKERKRQSSTDSAVEAIKGFAEVGSAFIDRDSKEFDPDDEPWEDSDESGS